ncbi:MAG: VWA domain-containing protein [SAR324 cluster bacterium]|nr:VWA domain-containing protein [SAR324 cluster bacterium]
MVDLAWVNPNLADLAGVLILRRDDGEDPAGPDDADTVLVFEETGTVKTDMGLTNGVTYHYAAYVYDADSNYSAGVTVEAAPIASGGGGGDGGGGTGNSPPVAIGGNASTTEGLPVSFTLTASDADGDPLVFTVVASTANGTLTGTAPTLTYTPDPGFSGTDSLTFKANDGTVDSNTATFSINVDAASMSLTLVTITTESPSVVNAAVRVLDALTGAPMTTLTAADFGAREDGQAISNTESFLDVVSVADEVPNVTFTMFTALLIDISSSILLSDLEVIKAGARSIIVDPGSCTYGQAGYPEGCASALLPRQRVTIYTFDDVVTPVVGYTQNIQSLLAAIDGIARGGPSTNLYGALITGLDSFTNTFTLSVINYGNLIVITDGNDTAGINTLSDVLMARGGKSVFAIGAGITDWNALDQIANRGTYSITDFSGLQAALDQVNYELENFHAGLYSVYYASPKRSGTHTLEVFIVGNSNLGPDATVSGTFPADGFSNVTPQLEVRGPTGLSLSQTVDLKAITRWTHDPVQYTWEVDDATVATISPDPFDTSTAVVTAAIVSGQGDVTVTVNETTFSLVANNPMKVADIYLTGIGPGENIILGISRDAEFTAETPNASANPLYEWEIANPAIATLSSSIGNSVNISIVSTADTSLTIDDAANGRSRTISVIVSDVAVSAGVSHTCALDDKGVVCWGGAFFGATPAPDDLSNPTQVTTGDIHTCAVDDSGVVCWVWDNYGQSTVPGGLSNPTQVSAGARHTCAVDNSVVICWGHNNYGQATVP